MVPYAKVTPTATPGSNCSILGTNKTGILDQIKFNVKTFASIRRKTGFFKLNYILIRTP